ncbi:retrovirus-related pol polyprotein from transposon TNT 1-94 [Tanacetum coccineum]
MNSLDPNPSKIPTKVEVPKELPKVSMVNTSLKKLKHHLAGFDVVVKERTTATTITEGSWGFEHTKACFKDKIIPFVKTLKDLFNTFDQFLIDELSEVQNIYHQMEQAVEQHVRPSTSASGSQSSGNTKNDKIQQPSSSTLKNKVEAHSRTVKSSLKNKNSVVKPKGTTNVQHSKLNANSKLLCVKCNGCMLFDNHDLCVLDFINDVNARVKSKSVKKSSKRKVWKPTGKVFINIGNTWRPTGWTFSIVGNVCLLTRITTTTEVPLRKPTALESDTPKPVVTLVYSRKPKKSKTNVPGSKPKNIKSLSANKKEPSKSWGSIVFDVPSMGKSKKKPHKPKSEDTNQEKLYLLHMDLCGPMRVARVNGKKYILIIVDDYSQFTWVKCLRSKDEALDFIIKFLKMIQVRLKMHVRRIKTDNGTKFVNQTLREYYENVDITHETSVARSPQQNGVVERRNHTLIEAARTLLIYAKAPLFLWAESVATACYTQNRSIISLRPGKTPYKLLHDKLLELSFFHVFGALCYPTNDSENLVIAPIAEVVTPEPAASTSSPSLITVDQNAPSPSNSQTTSETQSPVIPNDVEEDNHDLDVAHMNNDLFFGIPIPENNSEASSSSDVIPTVVHTTAPNSEHVTK